MSTSALAYTPWADTLSLAARLSGQMVPLFSKMSPDDKRDLLPKIDFRLTQLQNSLIGLNDSKSLNRLALIQYLARHIPGVESFEQPDIIYDELASVIWTHVPRGFDIIYTPFETPSFQNSDPEKKYRALINGWYFNRVDGSLYYAGLLAIAETRYTPFVPDDPQVTHLVCVDSKGEISFIPNQAYEETLLSSCALLFQWGPLVYSRVGNTLQENFMTSSYIGRANKRSVMVVFEQGGKQDLWFLTINEAVTLSEVRNIVLRETRFIGLYDTLSIFNLDGGSSVAHMNRDHPELNIGRTKILPIVFGIQ